MSTSVDPSVDPLVREGPPPTESEINQIESLKHKEETSNPEATDTTLGLAEANITEERGILDTSYTARKRHPPLPREPLPQLVEGFVSAYDDIAVENAESILSAAKTNEATEGTPIEGATPDPAKAVEAREATGSGFVSEYDSIPVPPSPAAAEVVAREAKAAARAKLEYIGPVEDAPPFQVDKDIMKTNLEALPTGEELKNMGEEKTDFLAIAAEGDMQALAQEELQKYTAGEEGMLTKSLKVLDYIFAPLAAPGAAIMAPFANPAETGSFLGDVLGNAVTAGDAFNERISRWGRSPLEGGTMPEYGAQIVENYMSNIPDKYKGAAAVSIELLTDPTIFLSAGLAKGMQASIKATRHMNQDSSFKGLIVDGLYKAMGWAPETSIASVVNKDLLDLAKRADGGDREALVELSQKMAGKKTSVMGTEDTVNMVNSIMKSDPNAGSYTIKKMEVDGQPINQDELITNIKELEARNQIQFNLASIDSTEGFVKTMDEAIEDYSHVFGEFASQSNKTTLQLSKEVNEHLSFFMGKDIHHFKPEEAFALRTIGASSAKQLIEFAQIMESSVASPAAKDVARIAFAKQLKVQQAIQAKIEGVGSAFGQGLESYKMRVC